MSDYLQGILRHDMFWVSVMSVSKWLATLVFIVNKLRRKMEKIISETET